MEPLSLVDDVEGKASKELDGLRERLEKESDRLTSSIGRFQIVGLIALAVFSVLLSNVEFRTRKWANLAGRLTGWEDRNNMRGPIRTLPYQFIETYQDHEADRKHLTDSILRTSVASEIPPEANLQQVSQILGERYYGVDFMYLNNVEKSLAIMDELVGQKTLKDLLNYNSEGYPLKPGEWLSLKAWFFSDNVLFAHRLLAERLPYEPEKSIQEYVKSARDLIGELKQKYPDASSEWVKHGFHTGYDPRGWRWIAWANLSDSTVSEWKSLLTDSIGAVSESTVLKTDKHVADWGSMIDWLKGQLNERTKAEMETDNAKATVWSVTFSVPIRAIVILFPLIYSCARCALLELRLNLRLNSARVNAIDAAIDSTLGSYRGLLQKLRPLSMEPPGALFGWNKVRFPLLFTEIAFEVAAASMAAYILYRGVHLAYLSMAGWIDSVLYSVVMAAALLLGLIFAKTSRSAMKNISERLVVNS